MPNYYQPEIECASREQITAWQNERLVQTCLLYTSNMATLLCFLSSDVNISVPMLQKALKYVVDRTYNMISVDGDTSTNDTLTIMTNCKAGNPEITEENEDYEAFLNLSLIHI